jgi:uncharacterized protein with PQ loop repeat
MNKSKKIWLGILSFLPLAAGIGFVIYMFTGFVPNMIRMEQQGTDEMPLAVLSQVTPFIITAVIVGLLSLVLLIYFIIHAMNNPQVKDDERVIWVLVLIFLGSLAFPVYWAMRIWPDLRPDSNFVRM